MSCMIMISDDWHTTVICRITAASHLLMDHNWNINLELARLANLLFYWVLDSFCSDNIFLLHFASINNIFLTNSSLVEAEEYSNQLLSCSNPLMLLRWQHSQLRVQLVLQCCYKKLNILIERSSLHTMYKSLQNIFDYLQANKDIKMAEWIMLIKAQSLLI